MSSLSTSINVKIDAVACLVQFVALLLAVAAWISESGFNRNSMYYSLKWKNEKNKTSTKYNKKKKPNKILHNTYVLNSKALYSSWWWRRRRWWWWSRRREKKLTFCCSCCSFSWTRTEIKIKKRKNHLPSFGNREFWEV